MIDFKLIPDWVYALLAALVVTLAAGAGWAANGWRKDAEISRLREAAQADLARENGRGLLLLAAAQARNDDLIEQLASAENARQIIAQEKDREIQRLTTGRRCLDAAVVRVLNAGNPAAGPGLVPPAIGSALPADAAFATDTDVGTWARQCRDAYDTARARLDAIRNFYQGAEQ